eukprot:GHRR01029243.1.p1 GENE.GHRR01029243.1~~GHRR01029243.1.p1  ORF type:complete len:125 (+),score=32.50 GHRR01029243.1:74-448(+)
MRSVGSPVFAPQGACALYDVEHSSTASLAHCKLYMAAGICDSNIMALHMSVIQVFFIVGEFLLVLFAVLLPSWRGQFLAGAVLSGISLGLWCLVPESGRWLHVQGKAEEAMQVIRRCTSNTMAQ